MICREHVNVASPAVLHLLAQVLFVTCQKQALQLACEASDSTLHKPSVPQESARLRTCKQLLIAMEVPPWALGYDTQ